MSHLMAIKTSYDRGDEMSLILEDDAVLSLLNLINFDAPLWLPRWSDVGEEPSATVLDVYKKEEH